MQYIKILITGLFVVLFFWSGRNENSFAYPLAIVVQGINVAPYNKAFDGIRSTYGPNLKKIILFDKKINIREYIKGENPAILFAIGRWALKELSQIRDVPIIYLMVLDPDVYIKGRKNICGIDMIIPAKNKLSCIKKYLPKLTSLGVIYNPKYSGKVVKELLLAAREEQIRVVAQEVDSYKEVVTAANAIAPNIDAFLMLPDVSLTNPATIRFISFFFLKKSIPIVTFSEKYLKMGAFMSIHSDPYDMGRQAGALGKKLIDKELEPPVRLYPQKIIIQINSHVAKELGIAIDKKLYVVAHTE